MKTRDELLQEINDEQAAWNALLVEVGEDRMEEPDSIGEWSFKDLAAHLMFWQDRMIDRMEAGPGGKPPAPWPASLGDEDEEANWDEINAWINDQYRDWSLADVLAGVDRSYERFARVVETMPEETLMTPGYFDEMGDKALVDANFFDHLHEEHEPSVSEWLQTR